MAASPPLTYARDPAPMLEQVQSQWGGRSDLWIFAYASLIWRPDFGPRPCSRCGAYAQYSASQVL